MEGRPARTQINLANKLLISTMRGGTVTRGDHLKTDGSRGIEDME